MQNGAFISMLNPALSLVLATSFLLVWHLQRGQAYLLSIAGAYVASAAGFLLQGFTLPIGFEAAKLVSNALFISAGILLSAGITKRYGRKVPWGGLALLGACGLSVFTWFLLVEPDLSKRIYAINFALGGMSLAVAAELGSRSANVLPARMLLVLALLGGVNFILRPIVTFPLGSMEPGDLRDSLYWATALLSHGVLSLLIALSLLAGAAMDVMTRLRREAHVDELGGILNRRGFEEAASVIRERAVARSRPITVLIADLDEFKPINDRYGHHMGDNVIVAFSTLIASAETCGGIAARIGGDEFAILLPADVNTARLFAEGVRTAFTGISAADLPAHEGLSASFGISTLAEQEPISAALRRADKALYEAKRSGRNCVRVSDQRVTLSATQRQSRISGMS